MTVPRPPLVPPEQKLPPRYVAPSKAQRRIIALLVMLVFLMALGIVTAVVIVVGRPELIGLERQRDLAQTELAIESTRSAFVLTEAFLVTEAARQQAAGIGLQATQAALVNRENRVQGTETQQAVNADITRTAVADSSFRQATESALNASATQAALAALATRVQQDFVATQTAIAGGLWTPVPTAPPNIIVIDSGYANTPERLQNTALPPNRVWSQTSAGLVAQVDHAALLTRADSFGRNYTVFVDFTPAPDAATSYDVLFGVRETGDSYGVRVFHSRGRISAVQLFRFEYRWLAGGDGIPVTSAQVLDGLTGDLASADSVSLRVQMIGGLVNVVVNNATLLSATLDGVTELRGAVGVQFNAGARLQRLTVEPAG